MDRRNLRERIVQAIQTSSCRVFKPSNSHHSIRMLPPSLHTWWSCRHAPCPRRPRGCSWWGPGCEGQSRWCEPAPRWSRCVGQADTASSASALGNHTNTRVCPLQWTWGLITRSFNIAVHPQGPEGLLGRAGEPSTATATFTQLLSSVNSSSVLLHVRRDRTDYWGQGAQDGSVNFHTAP